MGIIRCDSKLSHGFGHLLSADTMATLFLISLNLCSINEYIHSFDLFILVRKEWIWKEKTESIQPWEESIGPVVMHSYVCINYSKRTSEWPMLISYSIQTMSRGSRQQLWCAQFRERGSVLGDGNNFLRQTDIALGSGFKRHIGNSWSPVSRLR